ncbi:hypothetical protein PUMCH_001170 [Australozyma saopauloensis]|uniref:Autophagy-related protein 33 n=1 Tax=Australozyma saopauloensis TaxID=291208 RepID=A0AAX4H5R6_9ASCO|nr:hypothetical protein PUMCH_001170 [[Candida] saopauloensis]
MGRCLFVIKVAGATSLGLLTGSLAYQTWEAIPQLIRQLNNLSSSEKHLLTLQSISTTFTISNVLNLALAVVSSGLFTMAYKYAAPSGKHPYLLYSAVGAPLALLSMWYNGARAQCNISKRSRGKEVGCSSKGMFGFISGSGVPFSKCSAKCKKNVCKKTEAKKEPTPKPAEQVPIEEESLSLSYVQVSEDSLATSTPSASVPGSPAPMSTSAASDVTVGADEAVPVVSPIEEEVEYALSKKAYVRDLEIVKRGSVVASAIAAGALFISTIGVVGERLYL